MSAKQKRFSLHEIYKRPEPEVFSKLAKKHVNSQWWVVGPPPIVTTAVYALKTAGIFSHDIRTESFEGY